MFTAGAITSTPNINKGITILTANTDKVTYNLSMNRSAVNTIVFNVNLLTALMYAQSTALLKGQTS